MLGGENAIEIKRLMKLNRKGVLKVTLSYSLIAVLINVITARFGMHILGLFIFMLIWMLYFLQLHRFVQTITQSSDNRASWRVFYSLPEAVSFSKAIYMIISYSVWVVLFYALLRLSIQLNQLGIVLIFLMPFVFVFANGVNHIVMFKRGEAIGVRSYYQIAAAIIKNRKFYIFSVFQTIKTVFVGALFIVLLNIFLVGPQLQEALSLSGEYSSMEVTAVFSNTMSSIVQGVGAQALLFYVFYVTAVMYGVFQFQRKLDW